jgi:hypothetical protein
MNGIVVGVDGSPGAAEALRFGAPRDLPDRGRPPHPEDHD